jgi:outer membrane protein assembly factor BamD (BamD/ComL family)
LGGGVNVYRQVGNRNQTDVRSLYLQAIEAQKAGEVDLAIRLFLELEDYYPGLNNLISWHLVQLYQAKPDESLVQVRLKKLESQPLQPEFQAKVLYELMKSYVRANQLDLAQKKIEQLQKNFPKTDYGQASSYFQGVLALKAFDENWKTVHPEKPLDKAPLPMDVVSYWKAYLAKVPTGTFAMDIINTFKKRGHPPSVEEMSHYIQAYVHAGEYANAVKVANMRAFQVKIAGGDVLKAYLAVGQRQQALDFLNAWVGRYTFDAKTLKSVLEAMFPTQKASEAGVKTLEKLLSIAQVSNKEMILWHLSQYDEARQSAWYSRFASQFPNSRLTPFVEAERLRFQFIEAQYKALVPQAEAYLKRFPASLEAPDVLLWKAVVERSSGAMQASQASFERLLVEYPNTYGAFRANHILKAKTDVLGFQPAWPSENLPLIPDAIHTPEAWLVDYTKEHEDLPRIVSAQLQELATIKAVDDMALLVEMSFEKTSRHTPVLMSWIYLIDGQLDKSIRQVRDYYNTLDVSLSQKERYQLSPQVLKLLYPIHYPSFVQPFSEQAKVSPFLVLGLIHQESSFNPNSLSSASAVGLMQLLVPTAQDMLAQAEKSRVSKLALMDPELNIQLGTRYLAYLNQQLQHDPLLVVASYNAGPNAVARWATKRMAMLKSQPDAFVESIPYDQTRHYVHHVFEGIGVSRLLGSRPSCE